MKPYLTLLPLLLSANLLGTGSITLPPKSAQTMEIQTTPIRPLSKAPLGEFSGRVTLPSDALFALTTLTDATIVRLYAPEQSRIQKGDALIELRSAELIERQHAYIQALYNDEATSSRYERSRGMRQKGIISYETLIDHELAFKRARNERQRLESALRFYGLTQAQITHLKTQKQALPSLTLHAPFSGVITALHAEVGARFEAGATLLNLARANKTRWIELSIPTRHAKHLTQGAQVRFKGHLARIKTLGQTLNATRQSLLVRLESEGPFMVGQFVSGELEHQASRFGIPRRAVVRIEGEEVIFIQKDKGYEPIRITLLSSGVSDDEIIVQGPLKAGDYVVSVHASALKGIMEGLGAEDE